MLACLPYRLQIPLGLSLAILLSALLVTGVTAQHSARAARQDINSTVDRAASLLGSQAPPLLAADDTWRIYTLMRSTAGLLPGAGKGHARAAVLDADGRVVAASEPTRLETGQRMLGEVMRGSVLPPPGEVPRRTTLAAADGAITVIDPMRSEDGQLLGFGYIEVDAPVFAADWAALARPASIGVGLAVALLVPAGWWIGRRMTRPIARVAQVIGRIGRDDPAALRLMVPRTHDPELGQISAAVVRLIGEQQVRAQAEQRALAAERLAAVGRMTAAVAHEINNPLGGLLNATKTLAMHGGSEQARKRSLDLLERGLNQIRTTVAALLPQARMEDRVLEPGDLDDVVTLAEPYAARRAVRIQTRLEVESALHVPSAAMRQVMLNLLLNACHAAGERGLVSAVLQADARRVRFDVSNGGERLTREAFERTIAAEGGNDPRGFGLWVCREIATQYGGGFDLVASDAATTRLLFWMPNPVRHEDPAAD